MTTHLSTQTLYEQDYYLWLQKTLKHLRQRELGQLDWEHLIAEVEALGNEQRHKVDSYLAQILIHLLLYQYWQQERDRGWENKIDTFRIQLEFLLESKTSVTIFRNASNMFTLKLAVERLER